jgi:hypothetical protein
VTARRITRAETRGSLLLWFGILAGPLAWTTQVIVAPDLAEVLCYSGAEGSGRGQAYGVDIQVFIVALTALLTLVCLTGLVVSLRCSRVLRTSEDSTTAGRATWMARAGILVSALFTLATVIGFIPVFLLESCTTAP